MAKHPWLGAGVECVTMSEAADYNVIVLGAGAAGLMCAITAAERGRRVLVLEKSNKVGKKILMSGGGRCNFTNLYIEPENYLSLNPHFCKSALSQYTQWDFIARVNKHGIAYYEKSHRDNEGAEIHKGQLFCKKSSKQIVTMLLDDCSAAGVTIRTRCEVKAVECNYGFSVTTDTDTLHCDSLVVATGGLSVPTLGGSGYGYELARQYGMKVLEYRAGLVPLMLSGALKDLAGRLSGLAVHVDIHCGQQTFNDELLFTHRGLSGPAVLQISSYWHPGDEVVINVLPGKDILQLLLQAKKKNPRVLLRTVLADYLPKKLISECELLWWSEDKQTPLAELSHDRLKAIADQLSHWSIKPSATEGYRTAEVTLGGVDTADLSSQTMESKTRPQLYFVGEVVDVTGHLGGYNFQWAWSSGYVAGLNV